MLSASPGMDFPIRLLSIRSDHVILPLELDAFVDKLSIKTVVSVNLQECTIFVTVYSNTQSMPACQVVALDPSVDFVQPATLAFLVEPSRKLALFIVCYVYFVLFL